MTGVLTTLTLLPACLSLASQWELFIHRLLTHFQTLEMEKVRGTRGQMEVFTLLGWGWGLTLGHALLSTQPLCK